MEEADVEDLGPHSPVIVGIGFEQERSEDPLAGSEPVELMIRAVRGAGEDAGCPAALGQLESISVAQGTWQYRNPGRLIAEALGCPSARSVLSDLGVLQLTLLDDLFRAVAAGRQDLGVVTGGEARFRQLRGQITGQPVSETEQPEGTPPPDVHLTSADPFCSELEAQRGIASPVELFAIIESALRHARGLGIEEHRDEVARLYARFSEVAAGNPHAWRRETVSAQEIRDPAGRNAMLAFPYTKRHCSQWNVNQAVAILVCSAAKAEALGLDPRRWIHPLAAAESRHVVPLAQQRRLHSHPGTVMAGERALTLAGASAGDVTAAELYSCFPAAVQSFAHDLELDGACPWTVTGSMAFAGGPFNHASLDGVARMVEVLRADGAGRESSRRIGLVANLSGIFGKQAVALLSNVPRPGGFAYEDVTAAVAARDLPLPLDGDYVGPARVVGYTVVFRGDAPSHAIAICDIPTGARTVVRSEERALLAAMTREEFCGREVRVLEGGAFALA